jgi:mono/diheme cytochrome c family protein
MKTSQTGEDPGEDFNVRQKHGQIWREYSEPWELYRAIPWWLKHLIYAPLFIWALWYMLVFSGGFETEEYYEGVHFLNYSQGESENPGTKDSNASAEPTSRPDGKQIYANVCNACHQPTGLGIPGAFPPLAGSDWVAGDPKILSAILLHGLMGPIKVNGVDYNGAMPAMGAQLKDEEIAAVLTYVRSEWGNSAPPVEASTVIEIRDAFTGRAPWNVVDLDAAFPQ